MNLAQRLNEMTPLQRAVFALKETQARLDALEQKRTEPIAIVGMACRFPGGANDPTSFWQLLCNGVDAIREVPPDRWNAAELYDSDPAVPGKMNTRWGGFLERVDEFDNQFFGLTDAVASRMDPQHRVLLELAWEAFEDAGIPPASVRGTKVGVYVGVSLSEYGLLMSSDLSLANPYVASGTSLCMAANRLSFTFGLQGPSLALDTACSSSLVAVNLACQSLRNGDCESALVGAASLILSPIGNVNLTKAGFSAPDGRVRSFDASASGYVRSDGAGMVVLKPLSAALKNKDPIYAVIRGCAVNQNGSSNGITAPSRAAQEQLLREAYSKARVSPGQVGFVESQGTGTLLGDAIEMSALAAVLRQERPEGSRCTIGALKTNTGHMEAASGIASLIKTALVLKHRQLPPNLHFQTPNPEIPFAKLPFRMPRQLEPWPDASHPRYAGVSAFGFGGSNSHVVLEESRDQERESNGSDASVNLCLTLSARNEVALRELASRYVTFIGSDQPSWSDLCHTAANRRDHHDFRLAIVAASRQEAARALGDYLSGQMPRDVFAGRKPYGRKLKVAFRFKDCASECSHLISQLRDTSPSFDAVTENLDSICKRVLGWSLRAIRDDDSRWNDVSWNRTASLVLQLALTSWWRHIGIEPDSVMGTGAGELAAAVVAEILTTEEALRLSAVSDDISRETAVKDVNPQSASLPFFSFMDGKRHEGSDLDVSHWNSCSTHTQVIPPAVSGLDSRSIDYILEAGSFLSSGTNREDSGLIKNGASARGANSNASEILSAAAELHAAGADIAWARVQSTSGNCIRIPAYPWQRQRLWAIGNRRVASDLQQWSGASRAAAAREPAPATELITEIRERPELAVPYVAPRNKLELDLVESWTEILNVREIGVYDNFFELGGDSLQAMSLLNRLQEQLGESVSALALFESQNINDLSEFLQRQYPAALARQYPDGMEIVRHSHAVGSSKTGNGDAPSPTKSAVAIPRLTRDQEAEDLLARVDDLNDEEVEMLLGQEMIDDEVGV